MTLKVVDFPDQGKASEKEKKWLLKTIKELKEAVKAGKVEQLVLQYNERVPEEDRKEGPAYQSVIAYYDSEGDIDRTIGFASRLLLRLQAMAESEQ